MLFAFTGKSSRDRSKTRRKHSKGEAEIPTAADAASSPVESSPSNKVNTCSFCSLVSRVLDL